MNSCIHVAAAVITDGMGRVLVSKRPGHVHQGGLWEFPGGKLDPGETPEAALRRELHEELGIVAQTARPLIRVRHDYPDRSVLLDVWRVNGFTGQPTGLEGQRVDWVAVAELDGRVFPAADEPVIKAIKLPSSYLITPEPSGECFPADLRQSLERGIKLVQLRAKAMSAVEYRALVAQVLAVCHAVNARLLLNADPELARQTGADGVHLNSARLMACSARPLGTDRLVGASCHTQAELEHACDLGLDFAVVSPVQETRSHPGAAPLGFEGLRRLTELSTIPVYALGGLGATDLDRVFRHGAQGVAAIRGFWGRNAAA